MTRVHPKYLITPQVPDSDYPRWVQPRFDVNLREVAPHLFVGALQSPYVTDRWGVIVDLYGSSAYPRSMSCGYATARRVLRLPFDDGRRFPSGHLDQIASAVRNRTADAPALIHCQAGLSRSASAAYAIMRAEEGLSHSEALRRVQVPDREEFPMADTLRSARQWVAAQGNRRRRAGLP